MTYYCKDCQNFVDEEDLKIIWGKTRINPGGDEMVCPKCKGDDLDEVDDSYMAGYESGLERGKTIAIEVFKEKP